MADKLAVIQSEKTVEELNNISESVDKLVGSFNALIKVSGEFKTGMSTPKDLIESTKALNALYRENVANIKALEIANSQLAAAKAKLVKLEQQQAQTAKVINTSTTTQANGVSQLAGAFDELNQKYLAAKKNAMDMGVQHGIASKQFTDAVAVASKYGNALNQLDTAMRNYNSNINKSTGGMLGINMQMQQVIREAPNFGMDLRLGIAALSNNLPYLADAISNVREQNKALKLEFIQSAKAAEAEAIAKARATGASEARALALGAEARAQVMANYEAMKSPSLMKQIASSIFNWQTMLVLGITVLVMYSKEISEFIKNLGNANNVMQVSNDIRKGLVEMQKEANRNYATEQIHLKNLVTSIKNENLSKQQRLVAVKELQELYPKVFGNMTKEEILSSNLTKQYNLLTEAIKAKTMASAIEGKMVDLQNTKLESELKTKEKIAEYTTKAKALESGNSDKIGVFEQLQDEARMAQMGIFVDFNLGGKKGDLALAKAYRELAKKEIEAFKAEREVVNKSIEDLNKKYQKNTKIGFISTPNTKEPKAKKDNTKSDADRANRESLEALKQQYKDQKDAIENKYKLQLKAVEDNIKLAKDDPYLSSVEKNQKQMELYNQMININKEYYDKLIENAKDYNSKAKLNPIASPNDFINTTDFMTNRDTEAQGYQTAQTGLANQLPEDAKKDLDYEVKLLELAQEKGFEEAKLVVLGNQRITQREREYQLAILENQQKVEAINKNTEQLNLEKSALEKKDKLTRDEKMRLEEINAILAKNTNEIALTNREIENLKTERLIEQLRPIADIIKDTFRSMGLDKTADEFDSFYQAILNKNATFAEKFQESMELVGAFASDMIAQQTEKTIANLDEQLKASQSATEQELGFIQSRLDMMNAIEDATKEQIAERNALEDEARTIREQQLQKEKLIEAQKARAMQKAQAQQTLIAGFQAALLAYSSQLIPGDPTSPIRGAIASATTLEFAALQAALIMSKNPVPQYFVGRKDGKEEIAWTQEKGREIITDRSGKIKSLGSDDGAVLTKLSAGDRVYTASETAKILSEMEGMPKVGNELYRKIAKRDVSPIFIQNEKIDYDQLAQKVGEKFEQVSKKYDKIAYFEDENGNMFSQKGGQFPVFRGKKRKQSIVINTPRNERN